MEYAYAKLPLLDKEAFERVQNADDTLKFLRLYIPNAKDYITIFAYAGEIWHTTTSITSNQTKKLMLERLYQEVEEVLTELPIKVETQVEYVETGITEELFLRALATVTHHEVFAKI